MRSARKPLSRWEIVGAWLHVWTAPKGVDVPPVPKRKLALWGLVLVALLAVAAAIVVPPLQTGKREGAAERARDAAAARAAEHARLRADQRVHRAVAADEGDPVTALEGAITVDARARDKAGTIHGPVLGTECEPAGPHSASLPDTIVYKCFVRTAGGIPGQGGDVLSAGYSFVATVYTRTRKLAWCKQNPRADEKGSRGQADVPLSEECAGALVAVL